MHPQSSQQNEPLSFEKVWLMFQETDRKFQETDKKIKELATLFTGQWGKLVEALLGPGCLKMFRDIGIKINHTTANYVVKEKNKTIMEIDVLLVNDSEIVVVEVKTTAVTAHIEKLLSTLKKFKVHLKHYKNCTVYGAIAALRYEQNSDSFAEENGLYVIKSHGEGFMKIINEKKFVPKAF